MPEPNSIKKIYEKRPDKEFCVECHHHLPANSLYCFYCGPPELPRPPKNSMPGSKALLRITIIFSVFLTVVYFKEVKPDSSDAKKSIFSDVKFLEGIDLLEGGEEEKNNKPADDDDLKLVHFVNATHVNIRSEPTTQSKIISTVSKGMRLKVIKKNENWAEVDIDGQKGWIASRFLTSTIE